MYPVTDLYKEKIKENYRVFKVSIQIQHSAGVLELTDKDIASGSMTYAESSQAGDDFTVGGAVASTFDFTLIRKPEHNDIEFEGATVIPQVALLLSVGLDTENYSLSAPHPSEFEEGEGQEYWEWVPLGVFNIDDPVKLRNTIRIKAIDNMIKFDKPYNLSQLSYPATLYQIYVNACNVCDVNVATLDFPNKDYVVQERPEDDYTFRDIIGYVAELAGCFAKCNRTGALEIRWYENTGLELGPMNRFDFKPKDYQVKIKGIMATVDDTVYLTGTDDYAIDLSDNPLLQSDYETVLPNILNHIGNTVFTPCDSRWQGNPAVMAGDLVNHTDRDGNEYATLITHSTYKYRGASTMSAKGLPERARGFKGSTNKKIAQIKRKIEKEVGNRLTTLEQAQLDATELIANMLGGYTHFEADAFYISDNPVLAESTKIWKWGIGGFGYSDDSGLTYKTGITANGSIVANLISAGIVTADLIQTGILQSEDGKTWINLTNGEFNFQDKFKFTNGSFSVQLDDETIDEIVTEITPYTVVLGNENQAIPTDSNGKVKLTAFVQTRVDVYKGHTRIEGIIGTPILKDSDGNILDWSTNNYGTIGLLQPTDTESGIVTWLVPIETNLPTTTGVLEIPVTIDDMVQIKTLTWNKAIAGVDGSSAKLVSINPSHTNFISESVGTIINDYVWSPASILLGVTFQNCEFAGWEYSFDGTNWFTILDGQQGVTINATTKALTIFRLSSLYNTQNHVSFRVKSTTGEMDTITIPRIFNTLNLATRVTEAESKVELSNTAWSARFSSILNMGVKIRYIRDWQNGSVESPNFSYWNEIQVYDINGVNGASVGIVTASSAAHTSYPLSNWTDGSLSQYARVQGTGWQYLQWDLGIPTEGIAKIGIKHQGTGRRYNHKLEVSEDGINWFSLYDSEIDGYYTETSTPKIYELNVLQTGITTISATGVKVEHIGTNQYSEMRADGFVRKWPYGEAKYLNGIYAATLLVSEEDYYNAPRLTITLPSEFRGRGNDVEIVLIPREFWTPYMMSISISGDIRYYPRQLGLSLKVVSKNFNLTNPTITVEAYLHYFSAGDQGDTVYRDITFDLIVIGK